MTYERLAYDEADTVDHMQHDCEETAHQMHLPRQTTVANAVEQVSGLAASGAQAVKTTAVTVSDAAVKLAAKLLPF